MVPSNVEMIFSQIVVTFYTICQISASLTNRNGYNCETAAGNSSDFEKLRCRLFSNYNSSISPKTTSQDYLQTLNLSIFYADIDFSGIFRLIGEAKAIWEDDRLTWKPSEYNNTHSLAIRNNFHQIWKPDFTLINNIFRENEPLLGSENYIATVMHNGTVTWRIKCISIQASCNIKTKSRPWVDHTCRLHFKTSSSNFVFAIHNESESSPSDDELLNNSTVSDSDIKSPWTVHKTLKVNPTNGKRKSFNDDSILIDVDLHRNIGYSKPSTPCVEYPSSYEAELECYLFSNSDLLSPSPDSLSKEFHERPRAYMHIYHTDFNIEDGILQLGGEIRTTWFDKRMAWDTRKFGDLMTLYVKSNSIWKPSIIFNNNLLDAIEVINNGTFGEGECVVHFGLLYCLSSMNLRTKCNLNLKSWPWDPQRCVLNFTINTPAMEVEMLKAENSLFVFNHEEAAAVTSLWRITNIKHKRDYPEVNIEITFEMKNRSSQIVSCVTFVAVSLLVLSSFLITPTSRIKVASKISSLLLLVVYLVMLMNTIPDFTSRASNFLIGFVLLLLVVGISSCITAHMVRKSSSNHPSLIMKLTNSEESGGENYGIETISSDGITSFDGDNANEELVSKNYQNERLLKIATVVEYSSFSICSILVIILTMSFMI